MGLDWIVVGVGRATSSLLGTLVGETIINLATGSGFLPRLSVGYHPTIAMNTAKPTT